ncbi:MAG: sugar transferase [Prevotella sp.]|nr:sugar transferase [Prevotella sp.]
MKRILDFLIAALCLLVFSPLLLVCYLAIKIGGGPAIYRQERIGLHGKPFYIYKFRSMVVEAEKEGEELLQQDNDPRLTRIGRFLRTHHLDELPQLWNVLIGDMAFVGPRPERQYFIDKIMEHDARYSRLYALRPGVTSYATLYNGYTDTMEKMLKRLELDLYYLEHQSLWLDAKILMKTFVKIVSGRVFFLGACLLCTSPALCQQTEPASPDTLRTQITYDLSAEAAVGSGSYTAFQLSANRHHILSTRSNTAYLRGSINISHALAKEWKLSGAVDAVASVHADHRAYLQQCFVNLSYKTFFLEAGSREDKQIIRDNELSSGSFVLGTNAKPVPQVRIGTSDFWTVPYTRGWLQIHFEAGYGKFLDSGYREDLFQKSGTINQKYATGAYYHQKHLYLRSNPTKPFFVTVGIEHAAQFGGTNYLRENGVITAKEKPANLKAFWNVILPLGDSNYFENEALEDWIYGNHVGVMTYQVGWNIDAHHRLQAYLDNPFEDGSGVRKGNGWDGLWGLEYHNTTPGPQYVRGIVAEYFQSTNQSGPLHFDGGDYPEPFRSQMGGAVTGDDNYYNHLFYDSYTHYGMTPGNPLIPSPIYNADGYSAFRDNRVKAWHVGVNGELSERISYLIKGSYREGWGTYALPLASKHHSLDVLLQGQYALGPWHFSAAYAFDKGNIFGDCNTFNFKISYHGKIL